MKHRPWLEKHQDQLNIAQRVIRPLVSKPAKNSLDSHEETISSFGMRRFVKHREYSLSRIGLTFGIILFSLSALSSDIRGKISSILSPDSSHTSAPVMAPAEISPQTQSQLKTQSTDHIILSTHCSLTEGGSIWRVVKTYLTDRGLDNSEKHIGELVVPFLEKYGIDNPNTLPPGWSFMIEELPDGTVILSQN